MQMFEECSIQAQFVRSAGPSLASLHGCRDITERLDEVSTPIPLLPPQKRLADASVAVGARSQGNCVRTAWNRSSRNSYKRICVLHLADWPNRLYGYVLLSVVVGLSMTSFQ